jgi:hypothetical protein
VRNGETRIAIKDKRIGGLYVEIGAFRDFVVSDAYGQIQGQWGKPPPER